MSTTVFSIIFLLLLISTIICFCILIKSGCTKILDDKFKNLSVGQRYFLLDTYTSNKCIIEIIEIDRENRNVILKDTFDNEYTYTDKEFLNHVLIKNNRYYYELLDNESFKNCKDLYEKDN